MNATTNATETASTFNAATLAPAYVKIGQDMAKLEVKATNLRDTLARRVIDDLQDCTTATREAAFSALKAAVYASLAAKYKGKEQNAVAMGELDSVKNILQARFSESFKVEGAVRAGHALACKWLEKTPKTAEELAQAKRVRSLTWTLTDVLKALSDDAATVKAAVMNPAEGGESEGGESGPEMSALEKLAVGLDGAIAGALKAGVTPADILTALNDRVQRIASKATV